MSSQPVPFKRPFPALTPAQRYHFDAMGYVVVPNTIDHDLGATAFTVIPSRTSRAA